MSGSTRGRSCLENRELVLFFFSFSFYFFFQLLPKVAYLSLLSCSMNHEPLEKTGIETSTSYCAHITRTCYVAFLKDEVVAVLRY